MPAATTRHASMLAVALLSSAPVCANTLSWVEVPIPTGTPITNGGGETLDGYRSWDLTLHTTSDWTGAVLTIELDSGIIFQEPEGFGLNGVTLGQPTPAGIGPLPSSEYDTYFFDPHGGAHELYFGLFADAGVCPFINGESRCNPVTPTLIYFGWGSAGSDIDDVGSFQVARVTLHPDAQGTWSFGISAAGIATAIETSGAIVNGAFVPEPVAVVIAVLGCPVLLGRRRFYAEGGYA